MKNFVRFLLQESKKLPEEWSVYDMFSWIKDQFKVIEVGGRKRPRDPRPLLDTNGLLNENYIYSTLEMALLSAGRRLITAPTHCRDYFNEAIRWHVASPVERGYLTSYNCSVEWKGELDKDVFRAVLFLDSNKYGSVIPFDGIKNGCRVANMYGRVAGWKPIRVCRALVPVGKEGEVRECYVLTGDRNWQRTPQYISMLMLLIRICLSYEVPEWITDAYALTGWWHEFLYHTADRPDNSDVTVYLANSYHHMLLMVAHDREIFPWGMKRGFPSSGDGFHGSSGLNSLVHENSFHPKSANKLNKFYTEEILNGRGN